MFEPAHYVMERRMLLNLRTFAEGGKTSWWSEFADVALWTLTVAILVAALVAVARRRQWTSALTVAVMAAIVFQVLTLLQPPTVIGMVLVTWLAMSLWWRGAPSSPGFGEPTAQPAR